MRHPTLSIACASLLAGGLLAACHQRAPDADARDAPGLWGCLRPAEASAANTYELEITSQNGGVWATGGTGIRSRHSALANAPAAEPHVTLHTPGTLGLNRHVNHHVAVAGHWADGHAPGQGQGEPVFDVVAATMDSATCSS